MREAWHVIDVLSYFLQIQIQTLQIRMNLEEYIAHQSI